MGDGDEFVTILRSWNAQYIDSVVALLDAEGIPYEHPGRNHAALLPGLTFIEVQVRVPRTRLDEALALVRGVPDGEGESESKLAFRVRRTQETTGAFAALAAAMVGTAVAHALGVGLSQAAGFIVLASSSGVGYALGKTRRRDMCSLPGCAQILAQAIQVCPKCGSTIIGEIRTSADHFAALEALEESLASKPT
jgi:hypothetical protein